jgi:hypothetical protein
MDAYINARLDYEIAIQSTIPPYNTGYITEDMYRFRNDMWRNVSNTRALIPDQWIAIERELIGPWSVP